MSKDYIEVSPKFKVRVVEVRTNAEKLTTLVCKLVGYRGLFYLFYKDDYTDEDMTKVVEEYLYSSLKRDE